MIAGAVIPILTALLGGVAGGVGHGLAARQHAENERRKENLKEVEEAFKAEEGLHPSHATELLKRHVALGGDPAVGRTLHDGAIGRYIHGGIARSFVEHALAQAGGPPSQPEQPQEPPQATPQPQMPPVEGVNAETQRKFFNIGATNSPMSAPPLPTPQAEQLGRTYYPDQPTPSAPSAPAPQPGPTALPGPAPAPQPALPGPQSAPAMATKPPKISVHLDSHGKSSVTVEPQTIDPNEARFQSAFSQSLPGELAKPGNPPETAARDAASTAVRQTGVWPSDPGMRSLLNLSPEELVTALTHTTMTKLNSQLDDINKVVAAGHGVPSFPPDFFGRQVDEATKGLPLPKVIELKHMYAGKLSEGFIPKIMQEEGLPQNVARIKSILIAGSMMGGGSNVPDSWRQLSTGDLQALKLSETEMRLYNEGKHDIFAPGGMQKLHDAGSEFDYHKSLIQHGVSLTKEPDVAAGLAQGGTQGAVAALKRAGPEGRDIAAKQSGAVKEQEERVPVKLGAGEAEELTKAETTLTTLHNVRDFIGNNFPGGLPTGPIRGGMGAWLQEKAGIMGAQETTLRSSVQDLYNTKLRDISGAAVTASEESRMKAAYPKLTDAPSVFWPKLLYAIQAQETALKVRRGVLEADALRRLATPKAIEDITSAKGGDAPKAHYYNPKTKAFETR